MWGVTTTEVAAPPPISQPSFVSFTFNAVPVESGSSVPHPSPSSLFDISTNEEFVCLNRDNMKHRAVAHFLAVAFSLVLLYLGNLVTPQCSGFNSLKDQCPCSVTHLLQFAGMRFIAGEGFTICVAMLIISDMFGGKINWRATALMMIVMPNLYFCLSLYPALVLEFKNHVIGFGVYICASVYFMKWVAGNVAAKPYLVFMVGTSIAVIVAMGGLQVLYSHSPESQKSTLPYFPLYLNLIEFMWVRAVERRCDPQTLDAAAAAGIARLVVSCVEGLRCSILLFAIEVSSATGNDTPFLLTLLSSTVVEALARNKIFSLLFERVTCRPPTLWRPFKRLVNGCRYDSNYASLSSVLVLAVARWVPSPFYLQCDGTIIPLLTPALYYIVLMFGGEIVTDVVSYLLYLMLLRSGRAEQLGLSYSHLVFVDRRSMFRQVLLTLAELAYARGGLQAGVSLLRGQLELTSSD